MQDGNISRRGFIKLSAVTAATFAAGGLLGLKGAISNLYAADKAPLAESDATAKALCYHNNAAKVDAKKSECSKKAAPDGKTQKCATCMFYTSIDAKHGSCQIFPNNTVMAGGWCASWAKKPG